MASGNSLLFFVPLHNEPTTSNFATFDTRNQHSILDFDDTTDEGAVFKAIMPQNYAGGGVTVYIHWCAVATTGNVIWNAAFERVSPEYQDIDSDGFAAVQAVTDAAPGTSGYVTIASIAFTDGAQMDSVAAGEGFRLKITRDADNGSDTMTGDAELWAVEIRET